jgi:thermitase
MSLAVGVLSTLPAVAAPGPRPDTVDDELLVKFRPGTSGVQQSSAHQVAGGQVVREVPALDVKVVKVPRGQAAARLPLYLNNPNVEYAELNGIAYPTVDATDPLYPLQWALNNTGQTGGLVDKDIDAPQAWSVPLPPNAPPATIAIVDTGVWGNHPDLLGKVAASQSWTTATSDPNDYYGHGTHVAGIAAAAANNGVGISGVCQGCKLINAKVCDDYGSCLYDFVANGILWSVGCDWRDANGNCFGLQHARAINVSLAGTAPSQTLQAAIDKAVSLGAVVACAAGNSGVTTPYYPAANKNCIAVAATDNRDQKWAYSNYGSSWVDVAAPGVDILSTMLTSGNAFSDPSGYGLLSGTSMATPHVAGLAGLVAMLEPGWTATQIRNQIESQADRIPGTGSRGYWSKGRINACSAMGGVNC